MIVTDAGRDAVDAAAFCARRDCRAGWRKACERSTASGREMLQRTAKSCGPDAPTLASSLRSRVGPTGLRQDLIRKRRWQKSPVTEESSKETVKTIACGNVGRFRCTRLLVCVLPIPSAHEAAGATGIRRSPRPLWAEDPATPRAHCAARARTCV